jgi:hypothetical protein
MREIDVDDLLLEIDHIVNILTKIVLTASHNSKLNNQNPKQ